MKALVAALNRIAAALEQLVPALTQATREARAIRQGEQYYPNNPWIYNTWTGKIEADDE